MQIVKELWFDCSDGAADTQEHPMARFNPDRYPDRLAFEAYAHRIRAEEIDRAFRGAAAWLQEVEREVAHRFGRLAATRSGHFNRHPTR
jgi:hypothetical protein